MKRIGTITFHRSLNYGSVLQTYALQQAIQGVVPDCKSEVIDYYPPDIENIRGCFVPIHSVRNAVRNATALLYYPFFAARRRAFDDFLRREVQLGSTKYNTADELTDLDQKYDVLVAGSDQIWNKEATDFSPAYFFEKARNAKKIAYAPSLAGGTFSRPQDDAIFDALSQFSAISVRELSGKDKLDKFSQKSREITVTLDPTLLLSRQDYLKIESPSKEKGKYIFLYSVKMSPRTLEMARDIAKIRGLPLVTIYSGQGAFRAAHYGIRLSRRSAPGDFLALIRDAELVISDSFHGTAFSVNYRKDFYAICSKEPNKRDARIDTLLQRTGLQQRMVLFDAPLSGTFAEKADYSEVEERLEMLRAESLTFLRENL